MTSQVEGERIELAVLDSIIYGAAKAFDYLGDRGQEMLDKVGDGILSYCFREGYVQTSQDPQQLMGGLIKFFEENGYLAGFEMGQDGEATVLTMRGWRFLSLMKKLRNKDCFLLTCPLCLANNSMQRANNRGFKHFTEQVTEDGAYIVKGQMVPISKADNVAPAQHQANMKRVDDISISPTLVGLPIFETMEYGLACAFEYLGAQAQLLLGNVGNGIIEFLKEIFSLELPARPEKAIEKLAAFYTKRGLSDKIGFELSPTRLQLSFTNYRYARVLKHLLSEGHQLTTCPLTLASLSVLREIGWAPQEFTWTNLNANNANLTISLRKVTDQEFDETKVSKLMDAI